MGEAYIIFQACLKYNKIVSFYESLFEFSNYGYELTI